MDNFKGQVEFHYGSNDGDDNKEKNRADEKWWIPTPKVPPDGLSDVTRKWLQFQKEAVNQVHKAAMATNAEVLLQMQIPDKYIDDLPKVNIGPLPIFLDGADIYIYSDSLLFVAGLGRMGEQSLEIQSTRVLQMNTLIPTISFQTWTSIQSIKYWISRTKLRPLL